MQQPDFELDLIEFTRGCAEACSHCSESPDRRETHASKEVLLGGVSRLCEFEDMSGSQVFARFWYPFPASDPFGHRDLFAICDGIWRKRSVKCYLLSLGWGSRGEASAKALSENPASLFRFGLTVSNFSYLAEHNPELHRKRLAASLLGIKPLWDVVAEDGMPLVFLSPQFVADIDESSPYSATRTNALAEDVAKRAGFRLRDWDRENRVFRRPVVGLGRAKTKIGVTSLPRTPVTAETPEPAVSRFPEREYSAMLTLEGGVALYRAPRGILGRTRQQWDSIEWAELIQARGRARAGGPSVQTGPGLD